MKKIPKKFPMTVKIIGAGLAGVEAANILAREGFDVELYEMKPLKFSPAHKYNGFAELVCSNSFKAARTSSASGMLKREMRMFGSVTMEVADSTSVPAGGALAVDRLKFSDEITRRIRANPRIKIIVGEVTDFPEKNAIICTGPLTSDLFSKKISDKLNNNNNKENFLNFFDAAAPIVIAESVDMSRVFLASRYSGYDDKLFGDDYINCPMTETDYNIFYDALVNAEIAALHEFDKKNSVYEACMPVEVLAKRGRDSLRFGCLKPIGLTDPRTGKRPYAVVQLRAENSPATMYNLVGFQTNLKFSEQKRVFRLIPGLQNADFARYGVMHRNTFLNSPELLNSKFMFRESDNVYFAGQITGVEGYVESAASGIWAGLSLACNLKNIALPALPETSMLGALAAYVSGKLANVSGDFQPMGANMGLLLPLSTPIKDKRLKYENLAKRGFDDISNVMLNLCKFNFREKR